MGILNITPDSFYDGMLEISDEMIENKINELMDADIIDIGCESSRPGSTPITAKEEILRFKKVLPILDENKNKIFSIDTYKYEVVKIALEHGVKIINDITAANAEPSILSLAADYNASVVLMHMKGKPENMQNNPKYRSIMDTLESFFEERIECCLKYNVKLENVIIDPGIGFGKRVSDNDEVIKKLSILKQFSCPLLVGVSRKSFLQYMNNDPIDRLPATLGVTALAVNNGANIIRTHDVKETKNMLYSVERMI